MNHDLLRKANFPIFDTYSELVYLDSAATQQKPERVLQAVGQYYRAENANPLRGLYDLSVRATDAYENARRAVKQFIHAQDEAEIIFTRNATEGLNLVAQSWGRAFLHEGDEILVSIAEHHSNLLPWQLLAKEKGITLRYLDCDQKGVLSPDALRAALTEKTRLFAVTQVSNVIGRINPIREFAAICHRNGTVIVCDGAQSVPHIPVDVQALDVDFLAFSGHKMLAPMGIGVLYGKKALLEEMPPFLSGGEMIEYVTREGATYAPLPHKFEAGTVNVGGAVGLHAAIDYIRELGFTAIEQREAALTALCLEEMRKLPYVNILGSERAEEHCGIITFTVEGVHPHDIAYIFNSQNIAVRAGHHCAQPLHKHLGVMSTARASLAFYNDEQDIMRFIACLGQLRRSMGYHE